MKPLRSWAAAATCVGITSAAGSSDAGGRWVNRRLERRLKALRGAGVHHRWWKRLGEHVYEPCDPRTWGLGPVSSPDVIFSMVLP